MGTVLGGECPVLPGEDAVLAGEPGGDLARGDSPVELGMVLRHRVAHPGSSLTGVSPLSVPPWIPGMRGYAIGYSTRCEPVRNVHLSLLSVPHRACTANVPPASNLISPQLIPPKPNP